ncbi:MAG: molybdenum cofactor guanylyltransferase MobA [Candidatus Competibacteraceae bacterium]|jgi:molybdopterin-guanine dinucleotide biosynthesis protein A|nr:molybdenum cofactor guanylyltransferase MobA [Candidatus Competibacteraceae bacterium]
MTGVILAGGRAQRMGGQDKGLLLLAGQPMVAHVIRRLRPQVGELFINANRHSSAYRQLGCSVVSDGNDHFLGPLAGMLAAIRATKNAYVLSVPCDSPLLPTDYAQRMRAVLEREQAELCVAHDGQRLQPVFALLSKTLESSLSAYLEAGERKIDRWFARHRMVTADFADHPEMFRNINTPEELAVLAAELGES